jgi:NAD(P)-dependent dehydrogenase (short-subunit alcohol dehydrogenase family)
MSTVLITGAARGLGLEFTRQYAAKGWKIHACVRKPEGLKGMKGDIHPHRLEVTDYAAVKTLAAELSGEAIDVLICNAGVGGHGGDDQSLGSIDPAIWRQIFEINTLAPLMMAEAFVEHVACSTERKMIAITSILGSIASNNGGRYTYRASKSALNMEWSCLARDLAPRGITCVALHPGWVQTDMGGSMAPLTIDQSVPPMVKTIAALKPSDSGRYIQYDGKELAW